MGMQKEKRMFLAEAVFVGIDPSAGHRPYQYAALDSNLSIIALDSANLEDVLAFVAGLKQAIVAVDTPQSLSKGLLDDEQVRIRLNLRPRGRTWRKWRFAEYELRRRNIRLFRTPMDMDSAPGWMRQGLTLYQRLQQLGYRVFMQDDALDDHSFLEVNPHACFTSLLGRRPFLKQTMEGRMQRQLVLFLEGLDLPNPLQVLEEVTRHHLLTGDLPLDTLYTHEALDALISAYTAFLAGTNPTRITQVGDEDEGVITLPVETLKDFYH
jgi:predicted nuclease with RNAse H fold